MTAAMFVHADAAAASLGSVLRLDGDEGHHAAAVRRVRVGERLLVSDGAGTVLDVVVAGVGRHEVSVEVVGRTVEPVSDLTVTVVQALARGGRDESAVEAMTEVGVDRVAGWESHRTVARWSERTQRRWESTARTAGKQSRRARWPAVVGSWQLEDVAEACAAAAVAVVLHEQATEPIAGVVVPDAGEVVVVVGPEGGIDDDELAALRSTGAHVVRLGPTVLRSSTAGVVALSVLLAGARWRGSGTPSP